MNKQLNPLAQVTSLAEGYNYFRYTFSHLIKPGQEAEWRAAFYAEAATYDAIVFNKVRAAADKAEGDDVCCNMTDKLFDLHKEVGVYAGIRVAECDAAINSNNSNN